MKVAYVGDYYNHGYSLTTAGTSLILTLIEIQEIESVDIYCPLQNDNDAVELLPSKVRIIPIYDIKRPLSPLNLYAADWKKYSIVILNITPTMFGQSAVANFIGLTFPYILNKLRKLNIKIILHNSTYTNDVEKLGYNTKTDKLRKFVLSIIERLLIVNIPVYFPLKLYARIVRGKIKNAKAYYVDMKYLEGMATIYLNGKNKEKIIGKMNKLDKKVILLHGYWGPQKRLDLALNVLSRLREEGVEFTLVLSGGVNKNFPSYQLHYSELVSKYSWVIDVHKSYVPESSIMSLFLDSDIVLVPYIVPGGHSGVVETALTFENTLICIDHKEFREQVKGMPKVVLCDPSHLHETLLDVLTAEEGFLDDGPVNINRKIDYVYESIKKFLFDEP